MFVSVMATINMQIQASGFINYSPEFPQACQTPPRLRNILPILRSQSVLLGSWVQQTSSVHTQEDVTGGRQWWGSWQLTLLHELYEPNQTMHHECFMFHVQFSVTNHFWIFEDKILFLQAAYKHFVSVCTAACQNARLGIFQMECSHRMVKTITQSSHHLGIGKDYVKVSAEGFLASVNTYYQREVARLSASTGSESGTQCRYLGSSTSSTTVCMGWIRIFM